MSDVVVWSAGMVIPITAPSILDGAVAVRDGRIEHVGARDWVIETLTQRGLSFMERHFEGVLLPGLVNAHTHLQYTGMASVGAGQYRGFDSWARAFDEVYDAGLHGVAYWEVMSWSNEEWRARGEREVSESLDAMPTPPAVGISPHAPYSLDAEPLLDLPDMARRRGMRIHIHLGESHSEAEWSETRTTALADLWKSEHSSSFTAMRSRGGGFSSTQFVDQLGVLGPDCHVAHGVYMRADDRRRLRARQTAVALCPRSNRVIGLDAPPIAAYLTEGNMIAVGTDSLSSSPSLDLLEDVALLFDLAQAQGYQDQDLARRLLQAATLGGATAMGLATGPDRLGQLQSGAVADMCVVDVPVTSIVETIDTVARHGAGRVVETIVSGRVRYSASR